MGGQKKQLADISSSPSHTLRSWGTGRNEYNGWECSESDSVGLFEMIKGWKPSMI